MTGRERESDSGSSPTNASREVFTSEDAPPNQGKTRPGQREVPSEPLKGERTDKIDPVTGKRWIRIV